jgi:hypothetical protein
MAVQSVHTEPLLNWLALHPMQDLPSGATENWAAHWVQVALAALLLQSGPATQFAMVEKQVKQSPPLLPTVPGQM